MTPFIPRTVLLERFSPEKLVYFIIFINIFTFSVSLIYQLGFKIDFFGILTTIIFLSTVGADLLFVLYIEAYRKKDKEIFLRTNVLSYLFLLSILVIFLFTLSSTFHYIIWVFAIILAYSFYLPLQKQLKEEKRNGQD